jgi:hypothetical protein
MLSVAAKSVLRLLSEDKKHSCVDVRKELVDRAKADENFLKNFVTGDETWVYGYDIKTKAHSSQWVSKMSPRHKEAWQVQSNVKVMMTVSFDCEGIIRHEFLPHSQTVNKEYYLKVMQRLRGAVRSKGQICGEGKKWLLHHDNTPVHSSLLIHDFLTKLEMKLVPQPPYLPDLASADFFLFTQTISILKGQ